MAGAPATRLIIGNRAYSSWSLRGWLVCRAAELAFDEIVIPLDEADTKARILAHSAAGRVPCLILDGAPVWDSLAIAETLAERFPEAGLWPAEPAARAWARAICAEMHAGFVALRMDLPMDFKAPPRALSPGAETAADIARIAEIWRQARAAHAAAGPYLFGAFTIADAFYAPVVSRFRTYKVALDATCASYATAIESHPDYQAWRAAAETEPWVREPQFS